MNVILDTCVVSELVRPKPNARVVQFVREQNELTLYLSVLTIGELRKGIDLLVTGKKKHVLERWLEDELLTRFAGRVVSIGSDVAIRWGSLVASAEKGGKPRSTIDSLIAASALSIDASLATRNVSDFEMTGVKILNPWSL